MSALKRWLKSLIAKTPFRIRRAQALNRFESISEGMALISQYGFEPTQIIDAGANVGNFALMAHARFPRARVHMIEPQPACAEVLLGLCRRSNFSFHPAALVSPEHSGRKIGFLVTPGAVTTGARIANRSEDPQVERVEVDARSLDDLVAPHLGADERVFLKLDLEGHEFEALKGARMTLQSTEVVLAESTFFGDPPPTNGPLRLANFLAEHGFSLYDVLSISGRPRDKRARQCDLLFVKESSPLSLDRRWN
jgi:FkbM family methyltransferase